MTVTQICFKQITFCRARIIFPAFISPVRPLKILYHHHTPQICEVLLITVLFTRYQLTDTVLSKCGDTAMSRGNKNSFSKYNRLVFKFKLTSQL